MMFCSNVKAQDDAADATTSTGGCLTIEDLDFESCNLEDLSIDELKKVCSNLGLNVETDIFSYIFDEGDNEDEEPAPPKKDDASKEWTHKDYVAGAYECFAIEQEFHESGETDLDIDAIMEEDPEFIITLVSQLLDADPNLIDEVEAEMKRDHPEYWADLESDFKEGEVLKDRPDILSKILLQSFRDDPEILEHLMEIEYDDEEMMGEEL